MLTLTVTVILAALALVAVAALCSSRRAEGLARLRHDVEQEVGVFLRREEQVNQQLAEDLETGTCIDQAIGAYHSARAGILAADKTAQAWKWDNDDVAAWKAREFRRRGEEINRRLRLVGLSSALGIIALTVSVGAVLYQGLAAKPGNLAAPALPPLNGPAADATPLPPLPTAPDATSPATVPPPVDPTAAQP